jgi:hypothetical protein
MAKSESDNSETLNSEINDFLRQNGVLPISNLGGKLISLGVVFLIYGWIIKKIVIYLSFNKVSILGIIIFEVNKFNQVLSNLERHWIARYLSDATPIGSFRIAFKSVNTLLASFHVTNINLVSPNLGVLNLIYFLILCGTVICIILIFTVLAQTKLSVRFSKPKKISNDFINSLNPQKRVSGIFLVIFLVYCYLYYFLPSIFSQSLRIIDQPNLNPVEYSKEFMSEFATWLNTFGYVCLSFSVLVIIISKAYYRSRYRERYWILKSALED